ncbi:hypothetical protein Peur_029573 [Populus x canadensis]
MSVGGHFTGVRCVRTSLVTLPMLGMLRSFRRLKAIRNEEMFLVDLIWSPLFLGWTRGFEIHGKMVSEAPPFHMPPWGPRISSLALYNNVF